MCEYCKIKNENGDGINYIVYKEHPLGIKGEGLTEAISLLTPYEGAEWQLNVEISTGPYIEDDIIDTYIPINFCPFCGRRLCEDDQ